MEKRIIELEIKLTHQEELLRTLNEIVANLQRQVDAMGEQIQWLQKSQEVETPANEPPPHY